MNNTNELVKNLQLANKYLANYVYIGYDIYFIHGWFYSYMLSLSESGDDLWFPDYLVIDDTKIVDEKLFVKFVDNLLLIYTNLVNNAFEKNHSIKVLVNIEDPINYDFLNLSDLEQHNLLNWLFGYLNGWLVSWNDEISEYFSGDPELEEKFYQATFYLCGALIKLDHELTPKLIDPALENYNDLKLDIIEMWELDSKSILKEFDKLNDSYTTESLINGVNNALNSLFNIMRLIDERHTNEPSRN